MKNLDSRKFVVLITFLVIGMIFIFRLLYIQGIDDQWQSAAHEISENKMRIRPARGEIYDRNGELLVANIPVYDLLVTPKDVKDIDTAAFCELLGITHEEFLEKMERATNYASYKASPFEKQIPAEDHARIREQQYKYPGFSWESRTLRGYPHPNGAHVLGYIGEVSQDKLNEDKFYRRGDYTGATGIERYYEEYLRGQPGVRYILRDAFNNEINSYADGAFDTFAVSGENLYTTLDLQLQMYGEKLMNGKKGSIVAIEPKSGEILALVSSPTYDPNLLVGRIRGDNYTALSENDSLKPLFNRATMAHYPPGSIFKMVQALIALEEGVITPNTSFACNKNLVGCHNHGTSMNVTQAIQHSCNPYFYQTVKRIINRRESTSIFKDTELGLGKWKKQVESFGLGQRLKIDIPNIKGGYIPGVDYYNRMYGEGRWAYSTIYSISIGQGEVQVIPIQMANLAAIMANEGYYYIPHLVKRVGDDGQKLNQYLKKKYTAVSPEHYAFVKEAMRRVVEEPGGTARRARIDSMHVCGKTGTAENPHGEDHSVFIAFAPMEDPQIAIAVYVENAGFGGTWAAPIASLMMEKYINDSIAHPEKEQRILDANFIDPPQP